MEQEIEVLLVEDNPDDAEFAIAALKKYDLAKRLLHLWDGEEAINFLFGEGKFSGRQLANTPKVILLDLQIPKLNGIEVLQKIKCDERTRKIPVVVLTSSKENTDKKKCYNLGANGYVVKPLESDQFYKTVAEVGFYWLVNNQPPV